MTGSRPMNSGMSPYLEVSASALDDLRPVRAGHPALDLNPIGRFPPALDDLLEAVERPTADEQHVGRVDLDEVLVRGACGRPGAARWRASLEDLEQRLLAPAETSRVIDGLSALRAILSISSM